MGMTEKIPVKREDLYEFQFLSEASLSPDGRYAAYVVTQADKETRRASCLPPTGGRRPTRSLPCITACPWTAGRLRAF